MRSLFKDRAFGKNPTANFQYMQKLSLMVGVIAGKLVACPAATFVTFGGDRCGSPINRQQMGFLALLRQSDFSLALMASNCCRQCNFLTNNCKGYQFYAKIMFNFYHGNDIFFMWR
jgi:hypothetical protein